MLGVGVDGQERGALIRVIQFVQGRFDDLHLFKRGRTGPLQLTQLKRVFHDHCTAIEAVVHEGFNAASRFPVWLRHPPSTTPCSIAIPAPDASCGVVAWAALPISTMPSRYHGCGRKMVSSGRATMLDSGPRVARTSATMPPSGRQGADATGHRAGG